MTKSTHFPLEPGCEDYSLLDQAIEEFDHGLDSLLTDSINTPELDSYFDEADVIPSSLYLGFLYLVSTVSDNSGLQSAPSIKAQIMVPG